MEHTGHDHKANHPNSNEALPDLRRKLPGVSRRKEGRVLHAPREPARRMVQDEREESHMISLLSNIEIFPATWDTSRGYWVRLTDLDKEQARLESNLEGGSIAEHHKRREALQIYREILASMWGRDEVKL